MATGIMAGSGAKGGSPFCGARQTEASGNRTKQVLKLGLQVHFRKTPHKGY